MTVTVVVAAGDHDATLNKIKLINSALHITQLNAVAADFYLGISTTKKLYIAIRQQTPQITGTIQTLASHRMGDKTGCGFFLVTPVTHSNTNTANINIALYPEWAWLERRIEYMNGLVGERHTVGNASPGCPYLSDRIIDRPD